MTGRCSFARYRLLVAGAATWTCLCGTAFGLEPEGRLLLATGALPPLSASPGHPGFLDELARAAFRRIGIDVDVEALPPERAMINADEGIDDGDIYRIAGIERSFPNLVRVPEDVLDFEFTAYAKSPDIRIRTWDDLAPYAVAYTTGYRFYDLHVKAAREITKTASIEELFPLLESGRADVILVDRWQAQWIARREGYAVRRIEPALARTPMFMYLNRKHEALVAGVARALAEMKADGTYRKLYDTYLKPYDGP